jgi:hypothetical protein
MPAIRHANRSNAASPARPAWFGLIAALALGVALAGCSNATKTPVVKFVTPTPTVTPTPSPTPEVTPSPTPTPKPTPTPAPTIGPCNGNNLAIAIVPNGGLAWQSGGGHAQADFSLKNNGSTPCLIKSKSQPMLLNGDNSILITGPDPGAVTSLNLAPGATIKASVQTANLCAAPPIIAPVRVGFVISGTGLVIAPAASSSDVAGVPPCLGDNSVPSGEIQMTSWAP